MILDRFFDKGSKVIDFYYWYADDHRAWQTGRFEVEAFKDLLEYAYDKGYISEEEYNKQINHIKEATK